MIMAMFVFGPCHGKMFQVDNKQVQQDMIAIEDPNPNTPMFTPYEFGEPSGPPRPSMMHMRRHMYRLHDSFDQGVEEIAIYFHDEDCCEGTYAGSQEAIRQMPSLRQDKDRPRFGGPNRRDIY